MFINYYLGKKEPYFRLNDSFIVKLIFQSFLFQENRKKVIQNFCDNNNLKCDKLNFDKLASLTEGYTVGYLLQFIDRATFYAFRNGKKSIYLFNFQ